MVAVRVNVHEAGLTKIQKRTASCHAVWDWIKMDYLLRLDGRANTPRFPKRIWSMTQVFEFETMQSRLGTLEKRIAGRRGIDATTGRAGDETPKNWLVTHIFFSLFTIF